MYRSKIQTITVKNILYWLYSKYCKICTTFLNSNVGFQPDVVTVILCILDLI